MTLRAGRPNRIVLVGMMGSGKSTVGGLLSARLGWPYVDNDAVLGELFAMTPRRILDELGEPELRRMESEALHAALGRPPPCIVGAAAGTILDADDRRRLRQAGVVVWLRASVATLVGRAVGAAHRAWLDGGAEAWIGDAVEQRHPLYEAVADVVVDTDGRTPAETAAEIEARLSA